MKDQELYFRYDTLYITGDRYEFKKVKKRPLGIKLRRFIECASKMKTTTKQMKINRLFYSYL